MEWIEYVGLLGALLSGITFFPQVYKIWKMKSANEISLSMTLIILLSNIVWLVYAFEKNDLAIICANLFVGSCALTIIYFKFKFK
jgi:MtN3 and saliva related transmembrane protein|tara:strand:- start:2477 stop:2731 length:255 start_codon:yes stop_codon:yes gene_type:complete